MNTKYGGVTFVDDKDGLTVQTSAVDGAIVLSCDTGPVKASLRYTRKEAESLCRDLAERLGYFLAPQHGEAAPVVPEMTTHTVGDVR